MYQIGNIVIIVNTPETEHIGLAGEPGIILRSTATDSQVLVFKDRTTRVFVNTFLRYHSESYSQFRTNTLDGALNYHWCSEEVDREFKNTKCQVVGKDWGIEEILNYVSSSWEEEIVVKVTDDTDFSKDTLTVFVTPSDKVDIHLGNGVHISSSELLELLQQNKLQHNDLKTTMTCLEDIIANFGVVRPALRPDAWKPFDDCIGNLSSLKRVLSSILGQSEPPKRYLICGERPSLSPEHLAGLETIMQAPITKREISLNGLLDGTMPLDVTHNVEKQLKYRGIPVQEVPLSRRVEDSEMP